MKNVHAAMFTILGTVSLLANSAAGQTILRVKADAPAGGNGQSWATAYNTLQPAIAAAVAGDEIWVAAGTYIGGPGFSGFTMKSGVDVLGGYNGLEVQNQQRDPVANVTILRSNSTVVLFNEVTESLLDGFTITLGTGYGSLETPFDVNTSHQGGGLHLNNSNVVIRRCIVTQNHAYWPVNQFGPTGPSAGGGGFVRGSTVEFSSCQFTWNTMAAPVHFCSGGHGIVLGPPGSGCGLVGIGSTLSFIECAFRNNSAMSGAYAATCSAGSLTASQPGGSGGGVYASDCVSTFERCVFANNRAGSGAGQCLGGSAPAGNGGALCLLSGSASVRNSVFVSNRTGSGPVCEGAYGGFGSAIYSTGSLTVSNSVFYANRVIGNGANEGPVYGSVNSIANSVLWANLSQFGDPFVSQVGQGTTVFESCVIQGVPPGFGAANVNLNPLFLNPLGPDNILGTADDRFDLAITSPAIDAGNNSLYSGSALDLAGNARFFDVSFVPDTGVGTAPIIDIGPFEFSRCPADLDNGSGSGTADNAVTIDDLLYFLAAFESGTNAADLDNGTATGVLDNAVTIDDLLFFLVRFEIGC